jgi:protein-disulfide isomerase
MDNHALTVLAKPPRWSRCPRLMLLTLAVIIAAALIAGLRLYTGPRAQVLGHPPWVYGAPNARFAIIEFSDLECAYCRAYFPILRAWVDAHPDVNWEWRHLPLASHEPAATQSARIVECVGEVGGTGRFWKTVEWLYGHPDHSELRPEEFVDTSHRALIRKCLASERPDTILRNQTLEAAHHNVTGTPTLLVLDHDGDRSLMLAGMVSPDALSSALDGLAASTHLVAAER